MASSCGHAPSSASHPCHSPNIEKTPRRGLGFKGGTLRGLPHPRGQRTGKRKGQSTQHPSPIPGSSKLRRPAGWTEQCICRPSSCSPPPPRGGRRGDWGTRKLASAPLSCHLGLGDTPIHPTLSPSPVAIAPPRASCGEGASGASDVTGGLSQSQLPFEQPRGIPWSHPGPGVILSTVEYR